MTKKLTERQIQQVCDDATVLAAAATLHVPKHERRAHQSATRVLKLLMPGMFKVMLAAAKARR